MTKFISIFNYELPGKAVDLFGGQINKYFDILVSAFQDLSQWASKANVLDPEEKITFNVEVEGESVMFDKATLEYENLETGEKGTITGAEFALMSFARFLIQRAYFRNVKYDYVDQMMSLWSLMMLGFNHRLPLDPADADSFSANVERYRAKRSLGRLLLSEAAHTAMKAEWEIPFRDWVNGQEKFTEEVDRMVDFDLPFDKTPEPTVEYSRPVRGVTIVGTAVSDYLRSINRMADEGQLKVNDFQAGINVDEFGSSTYYTHQHGAPPVNFNPAEFGKVTLDLSSNVGDLAFQSSNMQDPNSPWYGLEVKSLLGEIIGDAVKLATMLGYDLETILRAELETRAEYSVANAQREATVDAAAFVGGNPYILFGNTNTDEEPETGCGCLAHDIPEVTPAQTTGEVDFGIGILVIEPAFGPGHHAIPDILQFLRTGGLDRK